MVAVNVRKDAAGQIVRKVHISKAVKRDDGNIEFVMSDETVDRYDDIIAAAGWQLTNFKRNPIALFGHQSSFPIGQWTDVRVQGKELRGVLVPAPEGTSQRIDEIRRLVEAGILKAVSVGFVPLEWEMRKDSDMGGVRYTKSELAECSVVSVPANPNALAVAKSLHISDDTIDLLFGKNADTGDGLLRQRSKGENANSRTTKPKGQQMSGIAKRIADAQTRLVSLRDSLQTAIEKMDDNSTDDALQTEIEEYNDQIATVEKSLATLQRAEASLARSSAAQTRSDVTHFEDGSSSAVEVRHARPFAVAAKKVKPVDYLWRSLAVAVKHHVGGRQQTVLDVLKDRYGEDETTRVVMARMVSKAAVVPASTTTSGWADTLVQTVMQDFIDALHPFSIYPQLAALGSSFTFGRNGVISMPARSSTPTLSGAFVLQGNAIPVKQAAFSAITLTPKKMGVITTMTREIAEHSTPAIEGIIRQAILDDTAVSLDTILMDNGAATATRPQGIQSAGTSVTPTSGGGIAALIGDLKALASALLTATLGNIRSPVWIMNPGDALAAALTQAAAGGDLPFRDELSRGLLIGYPVIRSTVGTTDTLYLVDAADFVTATGDVPRFDVSDQAVLHMEDTSPAAISAVGTPNTVAAPLRSLFQTDTMAIRMIMDVNWAWRRSGMAVYATTLTWN
jgi:HK97 family phage major capsid protein/HK97 family phage prohead protease